MTLDHDACYRALLARDARFDGVFFTGVRTTGIYCRPVCTAKTPARGSCRFFTSAAMAEREGFRPCLRCRPELAPGRAPLDAVRSVARVAAARIEAGGLNGGGLAHLAGELGLSTRQLRRAVRQEFGVSPIELALTSRLLMAKRLIAETNLPMTEVAFASGFASVRRFNDAFAAHYRLTPTIMRRNHRTPGGGDCLRLLLAYRPPYAWRELLNFLGERATPGVECVGDGSYRRTVAVGKHRGWLGVSPVKDRNLLAAKLATTLVPVLPAVLGRLKNLLDTDARPDAIEAHLRGDRTLAPLVRRTPGLRVPGAFDGFELAVRAVLGQQVSVRGASTLAGRLAARFGEPIDTAQACLNRLAPTAERLAAARVSDIGGIGIPRPRAESLRSLARAAADGEIELAPGPDPAAAVAGLVELPGIGDWTAQYIALRALRWPDAFPAGDLGLRKALGATSAAEVTSRAERWRPWRAYAAMHLWQSLSNHRE
ncbi:MAG: DNA-3-methyladenine glycosylase 2 family protein [Planctomycetota bacterium]|nr:MAG: DNA-3-methyladenine glycosylase 2 family protein [Planctomycetota bacterium]